MDRTLTPDRDSAPFFAAALDGRLALQRCADCRRLVAYPRARCPHCHGAELTWETLTGRATVHAVTVVHRSPDPSLADAVPYVVALVDLDEGARLMTNVVDCPAEAVRIGMRVEARFRRLSEQVAVPVFAPLTDAGDGGG